MVSPSTRGSEASVDRPRFRQDLVAEAVEDGGNKFIDVADPDTSTVYRFFEVEFSIACAMDGQRDAAGIRDWAKEELGLMPSLNEVRNVIASLRDLGYLDAAAAAEPSKPAEAPTRPTPPPPVAQQQSAAPKAAVAKGATLSGPAVQKPASPAQADKDLAPGIVVGAKGASSPTEDVELGRAGAGAAAAQAPTPKAADIALGAPGASAQPKPPKIPVEDVALGNAGAKDVSLDLADSFGVGKDDVKEAVRQSKVMTAVEIPKDLQDALDEKKPAAAAAAPAPAKPAEPVKPATPPAAASTSSAKASGAEPAQQSAKGDHGGKKGKKGKDKSQPVQQVKAPEPSKQPEAKKAEPAKVEPAKQDAKKSEPAKQDAKKAEPAKQEPKKGAQQQTKGDKKAVAPPPEPEKKTSGALIGLLIVVLLGGGAFLVWKYVLNKKTEGTTVTTNTPVKPVTPTPTPTPAPPPPPPAPKATIAMTTPTAAPQYSTFPGKLESIVKDGDVKKGDIIATLEGWKKFAPQRAKIEKDLKKFQDNVVAAMKLRDEARASNDAAANELNEKYDAAMLKVNEKQAELDKLNEEASKLEVMASHDGKLVGVAKVGTELKEETLLANIAQNPAPMVTFKFDAGNETRFDIGTAQVVMSGEQMVTCTVVESTLEQLTLVCPQGDTTKDGTELTFRAPTAHAN